MSIISEAIGGANVDNCPHACKTKPCGPLAQCIPNLESYECQCNKTNLQCNKAEELSLPLTTSVSSTPSTTTVASTTIIQPNSSDEKPLIESNQQNENDDYKLRAVPTFTKSSSTVLYTSDFAPTNDSNVVKDQDDDKRHYNKNTSNTDSNDNDYDYYYDDGDDYKNMDGDDIIESLVKPNSNEKEADNLKFVTKASVLSKITATTPSTSSSTSTTTTKILFTLANKPFTSSAASAMTSTSDAISNDDNDDDDDLVVTRVFGRYMTVDTKKLLKKEEMQKNKKVTVKHSAGKKSQTLKKHYIPMPLLKPQPPSLVNDEVEVDIDLPTSKIDYVTTSTAATTTTTTTASSSLTTATLTSALKDDENQQTQSLQTDENGDKNHDDIDDEFDAMGFYSNEDVLTTKELIDDMARIMKNGAEIRRNQMNHKTKYIRKGHGACFTGAGSYFHYNDAETMRQIISYKIDLNLRFKTHSHNGLILWTGRHSAQDDDDYLLLGIENGYDFDFVFFFYINNQNKSQIAITV